jgi:hypothetical protein
MTGSRRASVASAPPGRGSRANCAPEARLPGRAVADDRGLSPGRGPRTPSAFDGPTRRHLSSSNRTAQSIGSPEGRQATCRASRTNNSEELVGQRRPSQARRASAERTPRGQPSDVSNCSAAAPACEGHQNHLPQAAETEKVVLRPAVKRDQTPCLRASSLRARAISWGSVRLVSSAICLSSRTDWR